MCVGSFGNEPRVRASGEAGEGLKGSLSWVAARLNLDGVRTSSSNPADSLVEAVDGTSWGVDSQSLTQSSGDDREQDECGSHGS